MLLKEDQINKQIFLEILEDTVKWFGGEIETYVVHGKKEKFVVADGKHIQSITPLITPCRSKPNRFILYLPIGDEP
ncbi:hypothetical protein NHG32_01995 [Aerococcaceae bacterium NML191219]|nr:hypothetical protein [Aerococcaceae bacterium NML191219]